MLKALCERREFQISQNLLLCVSIALCGHDLSICVSIALCGRDLSICVSIALCGHDLSICVSITLCRHDRSIRVSMLCVGMIALCESRPQSACLPDL